MKILNLFFALILSATLFPAVSTASSVLTACELAFDSSPLILFQDDDGQIIYEHSNNLTIVGNSNSIKIYDEELLVISSDDDYTFSIPLFPSMEGDFWAGKTSNHVEINFLTGEGGIFMEKFTGLGNPGGDYMLDLINCSSSL